MHGAQIQFGFRAGLLATLLCLDSIALATETPEGVDDFLRAADQGRCVEQVTYEAIRRHGPGSAVTIVRAAQVALARRAEQQRALGCAGDIAARAIAAGADPQAILDATAAGL